MRQVLEDALTRWSAADLISDDQVVAIRDHEDAHGATPAGPAPAAATAAPVTASASAPAGDEDRSSMVAEGLAYVGAAIAFGAGASVFGELWADLSGGGRVALAAAATVVIGGAAWVLREHRAGSLARVCTLLSALTVVGAALTTVVALQELTSVDAEWIAVLGGLAGLAVGTPVHLGRSSWPTTLALGGSLLAAVFGAQDVLGLLDGAFVPGVTLTGLGLAWAAAGWGGAARPRSAFEVTGLLAGGIGVQVLAFEANTLAALVLGLLVAGAALAVGLSEDRTSPAVLGGLGLTVFSPQLVLELFGETIGGPLALFVGGVVLVAASVTVLRQQEVV